MSAKYHVNEKGEVKICNATKGKCRFGPHFTDKSEAQEYSDKNNQYVIGLENGDFKRKYANMKEYFNLSDEEFENQIGYLEKPVDDLIQDVKKSRPGRKLTNSDFNELKCAMYDISRCKEDIPTRMILKNNVPDDKKEELAEIFKKALPKSTSEFPALAVWETSQAYHIWTDNNNYLDMISVNKTSRTISAAEYKDLTKGAQIHQTLLKQNKENGKLILGSNTGFMPDKMKRQLDNYDPRENWNKDKVIDLTDREAAETFVRSHMEKDCTKLIYTGLDKKQHLIWFKGSVEENAQKLLDSNIKIQYTVRNNNISNSREVNNNDIEYFNKYYSDFFIDGKIPKNGEFTIRDIKYDCRKFSGPSKQYEESRSGLERREILEDDKSEETLRFGEFFIKKKDFQYNTVLNIKDFSRVKPAVTGTIKEIKREE